MSRKLIVVILFIFLPIMEGVMAQPSSGGPNPCFPPATPCIPIDGGVGFLIAAGIAYGGKMAYENSRKGRK